MGDETHAHAMREKLALYGCGRGGEKFAWEHHDVFQRILRCYDKRDIKWFHGKEVSSVKTIGKGEFIIVTVEEWNLYSGIAQFLKEKGLTEFEDFIWAKLWGKQIVCINANCHGAGLSDYLVRMTDFLDKFAIYPVPAVHENFRIDENLLRHSDVYIHQDIRTENKISYYLSDEYTTQFIGEKCLDITIPNFVGFGEWMFPFQRDADKQLIWGEKKDKATMLFRDEILDTAYKGGCKDLQSIRKYWMEFQYSDHSLNALFKKNIGRLREREASWDIKISKWLIDNYQKFPCFVDAWHPSVYLMREVCRQICDILHLKRADDSNWHYWFGISTPIMPCVAEHFQMEFQYPRQTYKGFFSGKKDDEIDDYIAAYMWWYYDIAL